MEEKYKQVMGYIRETARNGNWNAGKKLPSILYVSKLLSCNKDTVIRAYDELVSQNFAYSVPRSGFFLLTPEHPSEVPEKPLMIDFNPSIYGEKVFPDDNFRKCLRQSMDFYKNKSLTVQDVSGGLQSLRSALQKNLQNTQIFCKPENVFVTTGTQQAISLLVSTPFPNLKNTILVEQPMSIEVMDGLRLSGANVLGIKRTSKGIDFNELEAFFKNKEIKFFYTMPRFQIPTGYTYTEPDKKEMLRLAHKYDVIIVEEDSFAEMDPNKKRDPLFSMSLNGNVIHLRGFSRILFPWLRLGMLVLPNSIAPAFRNMKICSDFLEQGALELYIKNGMYNKHVDLTGKILSVRQKVFKDACHEHLQGKGVFNPTESGRFASVELTPTVNAEQLASALEARNIQISFAKTPLLTTDNSPPLLSLNLSSVDEAQIKSGIEHISALLP